MKRILSILCVAAVAAMIFPVISAAQGSFSFGPTATPVVSADPAAARPMAVGPVATGGATLSLQVSTTTFAAPMDMYLGLFAPFLSPDIFLFASDTALQPISTAAKWRAGVTSANAALLGNIPTAILPQGTYFVLLLVTPAGSNLTNTTLWQTSFTVGPPAVAPQADAYTWIGNTPLTVAAAQGVLANDPPGSTVTASDAATTAGGTVAVAPDGSFVYTPAAGARGADSFTYTAAGATATVTITMDTVAWYVNNTVAAGGNGSFASPFSTLVAAQGPSLNGDTIFVFSGTGSAGMDSGVTLKTGQKLLGQGLAFTFAGTPIVPAGALPVIANTLAAAGAVTIVTLAGNNEVAGVQLSGAGATGNIIGFSGTAVAGFNIHDNVIDGLNREGILLSNATGTGIVTNNTFSNLAGPNAGNAVDYITNAAGVSLGINGNTFSTVGESCIRVRFDAGGGTVSVTGNTLTTAVATNAGSRGIDVDASGTSVVSSIISNNTVGSAATVPIDRAGIQVNATLSGTHRAALLNNTVVNAGADGSGGIEAQTDAAATICLQLAANSSAGGGPGYNLDNRALGTFQVEGDQATLQAGNTGNFTFLPGVLNVTFVPAGTCGF